MSERTYKLLDGTNLIADGDVLFITSHSVDAVQVDDHDVMGEVLALVDSLQQQLTVLASEHAYAKQQAIYWNDEAVRLREQMADRDRKIAWLTNELGE